MAAVAEDPVVSVEVGDRALGRGCLQEGRVVNENVRIELAERLGRDTAVLDRDLDTLPGAVVDDRVAVGHGPTPLPPFPGSWQTQEPSCEMWLLRVTVDPDF